MSITVQTNVSSLQAQRHLSGTLNGLSRSVEKLSSGFRINSAADDAAGLAISEEMKADLRSLMQARRNASDAVSFLQTAESALGDIASILGRMRELAMQAANDGVNDGQRGYINTEVVELQAEIDRIVSVTEFNGSALLDGTLDVTFLVGLDSGDTIGVALASSVNSAALGVDAGAVDMSTRAGADGSLVLIDAALTTISSERAEFGAKENRLGVIEGNLSISYENLAAANSRIRDTDVAMEMASFTKSQILIQAGTSMLAQANSFPQVALALLGG